MQLTTNRIGASWGGCGRVVGTPSLTKAWALCFLFASPRSFPVTPQPSLPPGSRGAVTEQLLFCLLGRGPGSSEEEEIPELEIDVDELLDMESDDARAARVKELLVDCYKPTEAFISGLLDKIRGMQKLSTPQKK
nr:protein phosphatase 1 regulatory subunit 14B isoform X2 [Pongo pygmaeus]